MHALVRSTYLIAIMLACSKREEAKPTKAEQEAKEPAAKPPAGAEVVRGRPGTETDEQIRAEVEALEAAAQRGEIQWSQTEGHDLVTLGKDGKSTTKPFPAPKHNSGDAMYGVWLAPDGTLFTAGYMITGKPGPDTGAIHRMKPGGALERVFELPEREFWDIWGRTLNDIYAIGPKVVMHWDGKAWTEIPIAGVDGTINTVAGNTSDVWIVAVNNDPEESRIYKLTGKTWTKETEMPCLLRGLSFADTTAYAAGACNVVFRRGPDGTWKNERIPQGGAFDVVAVSPAVAYVAAEQLLRRVNGTWVATDAGFPRVHGVYRARGEQVFVLGNHVASGGSSGLAIGAGTKFEKLPLDDCNEVASTADVVYCIRERHVAAEPPADLRR